MKYDPIEDDPRLGPIVRKAERQAERELKEFEGQMGFCHMLWGRMEEILREEHGIEWRSPDAMNPGVLFD